MGARRSALGTEDIVRRALASRERRTLAAGGMPSAAVLIPLYDWAGRQHVLLTLRTHLVEHHKGQISFPGGAHDPDDPHLAHTALRETFEEIGVEPGHVEVLGALDDIVTISNFLVTPYVGVVRGPVPYPFRRNEREVEELLEVPLSHLLIEENVFSETREVNGRATPAYSYRFGEHVIWGATSRMLKGFLDLLAPHIEDGPA